MSSLVCLNVCCMLVVLGVSFVACLCVRLLARLFRSFVRFVHLWLVLPCELFYLFGFVLFRFSCLVVLLFDFVLCFG